MIVRYFARYTCVIDEDDQTIEIRERDCHNPLLPEENRAVQEWMLSELAPYLQAGFEILDKTWELAI